VVRNTPTQVPPIVTLTDTATVTSTPTVTSTATSTHTPQVCGDTGEKNVTCYVDLNGGGHICTQVTLASDARVPGLNCYLYDTPPASGVQMALYDEVAGQPGNRLALSVVTSVVSGWNSISIPEQNLAAGNYWVGLSSADEYKVFGNRTEGLMVVGSGSFPPTYPMVADMYVYSFCLTIETECP
jgi:hypothetical protein